MGSDITTHFTQAFPCNKTKQPRIASLSSAGPTMPPRIFNHFSLTFLSFLWFLSNHTEPNIVAIDVASMYARATACINKL